MRQKSFKFFIQDFFSTIVQVCFGVQMTSSKAEFCSTYIATEFFIYYRLAFYHRLAWWKAKKWWTVRYACLEVTFTSFTLDLKPHFFGQFCIILFALTYRVISLSHKFADSAAGLRATHHFVDRVRSEQEQPVQAERKQNISRYIFI